MIMTERCVMMKCRVIVVLVVWMAAVASAMGGPRWRAFKNWIDSADVKGCDTSYVSLPKEGFAVYLNNTVAGSTAVVDYHFHTGNVGPNGTYSGVLRSRLTYMLALRFSYRGWGLSYSKDFSHNGDSEFSFTTYGQRYGFELRLYDTHTLSGTLTNREVIPNAIYKTSQGDIHQKLLLINLYYVFSRQRFSLPAAMSQTVIQRRSAGSWLALLNYYHTDMDKAFEYSHVIFRQYSLGGGYAYNYVFAHEHCLLHGALMPMAMVWNHGSSDNNSNLSQEMSVNLTSHVGFVYNFDRYMAGFSFYYNMEWINLKQQYRYIDNSFSSTFYLGVRF